MSDTNKKYYLEEMHLFDKNGMQFVFLPTKLLLFQVDEDTYSELIAMKDKFGTETPIEEKDDVLLEAGIMYEADEPIDDVVKKAYEARSEKQDEENTPIPVTSTVLQIANDCNLNCIYCYGDGGSYGRERELMTFETAKKSIDFMVANSADVERLTVIFFGGEPLINFDVVKKTFDYCKSIEESSGKKFRFSMTTNGTILTDEIYNFIKDNKISVMISMDGGKELQNKHRCYCDGKGSFEDIVKNIERFKEARGGHLTARSTVCSTDIRFKKIKDDLLALGFTNAVTSMVDTSEDSELFIGGDFTERVIEQYQILCDDYVNSLKEGKPFPQNLFESAFKTLYFKLMKIRSCSAGNSGIAVGTNELIYPCHRFMGMPEHSMGTLDTGINEEIRAKYRQANIYTKEGCKDCWARYLCNGGCAHISACHGGIFHAPDCYCDIYRGLYEIILHAYWELKEWDNDVFKKQLEKADTPVNTLSE